MLASIMPGFRDLRTPLVVGYMWFLNLWLILGQERIVPAQPSNEFTARIYDLTELLGTGAIFVILSFCGYVFGSVIVYAVNTVIDAFTFDRMHPDAFYSVQQTEPWESTLNRWLYVQVSQKLSKQPTSQEFLRLPATEEFLVKHSLDNQLGPSNPNAYTIAYLFRLAIAEEFSDLVTRLKIARESVWQDYDRLQAESELRLNIVPPILVLIAVLTWMWSPFWLFALALPAVLLRHGFSLRSRAQNQVL